MSVQEPEKQPVMDLPTPVPLAPEVKKGGSEVPQPVLSQGTERNPEFTSQQTTAQQSNGLPPPVAQIPTMPAQQTNASQTDETPKQKPPTTSDMPQMADDVDLIEKEWVEKAKQIVEKTKEDPRAQSEALDKVKNEYQKRRFNREAVRGKEN